MCRHGIGSVATVPLAADHADVHLVVFDQFLPPDGEEIADAGGHGGMHILVQHGPVGQSNVDTVGIKATAVTEVTQTIDGPPVPTGAVGNGLIEAITAVAQKSLAFLPQKKTTDQKYY